MTTTARVYRRHRTRAQRRRAAALPVRVLKAMVLTFCVLVVVVPFVSIIATSLAPADQVDRSGGLVLFPEHLDFTAYAAILSGGTVARALVVSLLVTVVGTLISLAATTTLAYALSKPGALAARPILFVVLFSLLFTPGIIPQYLIVKELGLLDSYWSLVLPVAMNAFNVIVMRAFFMGIPVELTDAARTDGASEWRILLRVVLPLSKAVVAVIGLFYAVAYWNNFFSALLYITDTEKWPLSLILRTFVVNSAQISTGDLGAVGAAPPQTSLRMAILVISILPILLVYPFLQKYFAKGVLVGAVKG
ncbi:carbohydrate ABC transporter permease [Actinophytocola oryzae]|uniref:Carbohydrate ABC transporter membrane protein 2 (CUT1 family) n=1 Tax=Actinophytocola oryzae TaxID=502181 RepID=A0A4R7VJQ1_9PSEU|nr:carbohydrate ABC transporter permease [Actinophytocola oryzae]TDV49686.1 carbohydrate ABC transporter membrane protein 2 (CUT1 family) [Actinophytocola oryzae]